MSGIKVQGSATGAGNFTITPPNGGASDRVLTLPDASGKVSLLDGPAFAAHASATTTLVTSTATKVTFGAEEFDTGGCYDPSTSRFQPNVSGYYWVGAGLRLSTSATGLQMFVYKNGAPYREVGSMNGSNQQNAGGALVFLNGTTDYVEIYVVQSATAQTDIADPIYTYFHGYMVRVP
jgi:hypothetical protein